MKQLLLYFIFSFFIGVLSMSKCIAQVKGFSVSTAQQSQNISGITYALIVGISKYQNASIPQLQFADRDAIAFRNYLVASGVDSNNITLLTNENAKYSEILLDLDDICTNKVKAGDKFYFYFSGHGDVESRVITNDGYLLPYDAPKVVYAISAVPVRVLQSYISTLSSKGVQAIVITDACHSGNLAGGIEGMANIQNVLKDTWKDEIKILSCQPGELSLEGKQWGNGRGLFSYELINGLAGDADKNNDGKVSLNELNRYLSLKVPDEADPLPQFPMVTGNMQTEISSVNNNYLAQINSSNTNSIFAAIDIKGDEEGLLKGLPDSVKEYYQLFKKCIEVNYLNDALQFPDEEVSTFLLDMKRRSLGVTGSAYTYYLKIPRSNSTSSLIASMKSTLAGAMINEVNEGISKMLNNELYQNSSFYFQFCPDYLLSLTTLLGKEKLLSMGLLSKIYYNKALLVENADALGRSRAISLLDSAISFDTNASYALELLSNYYSIPIIGNPDSAIILAKRSASISPKFLAPYITIAKNYQVIGQFDSVFYYYKKLGDSCPQFNISGWIGFGKAFRKLGNMDSSNYYFNKVPVKEIGFHELGINYYLLDDISKGNHYFMESNSARDTINKYDYIYESKQEIYEIANAFYDAKKYQKAIYYWKKHLKETEEKKSNISFGDNFLIACCYSLLHDKENAIVCLNKYFHQSNKEISYRDIQGVHDLDFIRTTSEFKALMKKYFPEQFVEK